MQARKIVITVAAGLVIATGIAACSGVDSGAEASSSSSASTEPGEEKAAAQETAPPTITYTTADGTAVEVDPAAPLPAPVVEDATAKVAASYDPTSDSGTAAKYDGLIEEISAQTGKRILLVAPVYGLLKDDDPYLDPYLMWAVKGIGPHQVSVDQAAQIAAATTWVAEQDAPETFEIIVTPAYQNTGP